MYTVWRGVRHARKNDPRVPIDECQFPSQASAGVVQHDCFAIAQTDAHNRLRSIVRVL